MENNDLRKQEAIKWLNGKGIQVKTKGIWHFSVTLSTVNMEHWLYKRNLLKPEDIMLELTLRDFGTWVVQLERHDRIFVSQWRKDNRFEIESQQLKYRKLIRWPELKSLNDFPKLVPEIESALHIKFTGHVNIAVDFIDLESHLTLNSTLAKWLGDCCTTLGTKMLEP